MNYFAYGSNMSVARIRSRVPSAQVMGVFTLRGHALRFHKIGKDGTAKCDAWLTGNESHVVEGVVYAVDAIEIGALDHAEGLGQGYSKHDVQVFDASAREIESFTYRATDIDASLKPFSWYKRHVSFGAEQHGLSPSYRAVIEQVDSIPDSDSKRESAELSIYAT